MRLAKEVIFLIPIVLIFLVAQIPNSDAKLNLEDMFFQSSNGNVVIDFGKNLKQGSDVIPTLDFGIVKTSNQNYYFDFTNDVSVNVYGNSFVIKSLEKNPLLIYAHNVGGNNYVLNFYTVDKGFKKQTFSGKLESVLDIEEKVPEKIAEPEKIKPFPEMKLLIKQTDRVYWQYDYFLSARIFDAKQNQLNDFDQNYGFIPGIDILVEIFNPQKKLLTSMSGKTENFGSFDVRYNIAHLTPKGTYTVNVTADNGQVLLTETIPMFVMGDKSSSGNGTAP